MGNRSVRRTQEELDQLASSLADSPPPGPDELRNSLSRCAHIGLSRIGRTDLHADIQFQLRAEFLQRLEATARFQHPDAFELLFGKVGPAAPEQGWPQLVDDWRVPFWESEAGVAEEVSPEDAIVLLQRMASTDERADWSRMRRELGILLVESEEMRALVSRRLRSSSSPVHVHDIGGVTVETATFSNRSALDLESRILELLGESEITVVPQRPRFKGAGFLLRLSERAPLFAVKRLAHRLLLTPPPSASTDRAP